MECECELAGNIATTVSRVQHALVLQKFEIYWQGGALDWCTCQAAGLSETTMYQENNGGRQPEQEAAARMW